MEKKRNLDSLLMSLQLHITITLFHSLTCIWTKLQIRKQKYNFSILSNNTPKTLKMNKNFNPSLRPSASDVWDIYRIEMDKKMSLKIREADYF